MTNKVIHRLFIHSNLYIYNGEQWHDFSFSRFPCLIGGFRPFFIRYSEFFAMKLITNSLKVKGEFVLVSFPASHVRFDVSGLSIVRLTFLQQRWGQQGLVSLFWETWDMSSVFFSFSDKLKPLVLVFSDQQFEHHPLMTPLPFS